MENLELNNFINEIKEISNHLDDTQSEMMIRVLRELVKCFNVSLNDAEKCDNIVEMYEKQNLKVLTEREFNKILEYYVKKNYIPEFNIVNIKEVLLPKTITKIDNNVNPSFYQYNQYNLGFEKRWDSKDIQIKIDKLVVPEGVTKIGNWFLTSRFFYNDRVIKISEVSLPSTLKTIGDGCLDNIEKVNLPDGIIEIGSESFTEFDISKCDNGKLVLPSALKVLKKGAFHNLQGKGEIVLNCADLEYIGENCLTVDEKFDKDGKLKSEDNIFINKLFIPDNVYGIGEGSFRDVHINKIEVSDSNTYFDSRDNCNAIIETRSKILYLGCSSTVIPKSVKAIRSYAITDQKTKNLKIPKNIVTFCNGSVVLNKLESLDLSGVRNITTRTFNINSIERVKGLSDKNALTVIASINYSAENFNKLTEKTGKYMLVFESENGLLYDIRRSRLVERKDDKNKYYLTFEPKKNSVSINSDDYTRLVTKNTLNQFSVEGNLLNAITSIYEIGFNIDFRYIDTSKIHVYTVSIEDDADRVHDRYINNGRVYTNSIKLEKEVPIKEIVDMIKTK